MAHLHSETPKIKRYTYTYSLQILRNTLRGEPEEGLGFQSSHRQGLQLLSSERLRSSQLQKVNSSLSYRISQDLQWSNVPQDSPRGSRMQHFPKLFFHKIAHGLGLHKNKLQSSKLGTWGSWKSNPAFSSPIIVLWSLKRETLIIFTHVMELSLTAHPSHSTTQNTQREKMFLQWRVTCRLLASPLWPESIIESQGCYI